MPRRTFRGFAAWALLACATLFAGTAAAQTPGVLVSNFDQTITTVGSGVRRATAFNTGANADGVGFTLTEVRMRLSAITGFNSSTTYVQIYNDNSGSIGTLLANLTSPSSAVAGNSNNTFTAPSGTTLAENSKYWVVINDATGSDPGILFRYTTSNGESASTLTGWSIDDSALLWDIPNSEWQSSSRKLAINVRGYANVNAAPVFTEGASTTRSFNENVGDVGFITPFDIGSPVEATDVDGDTLTYSVSNLEGGQSTAFTINSSTGQIKSIPGANYSFERFPSLFAKVKVDDGNGNTATIDVTVNVNDVDEPPLRITALTVTAAGQDLQVSWTAGNNAERPPVTGYDLRYKKTADTGWTDGPQNVTGRSSLITMLEATTAYQVQVQAINHEGRSSWSSSTTATTGTNTADPTGLPTITGQSQVGATLTANTSGISDADGLNSPGWSYQWIRVDDGAETDISTQGTNRTYLLRASDLGKTIKLRVRFVDDQGNISELTSDAYPARGYPSQGIGPARSGCPSGSDWCTLLTVGVADLGGGDVYYGYGPDSGGYGSLDNTTITSGAVSFEVTQISIFDASNDGVVVGLNDFLPEGSVLNLAGFVFDTDEATRSSTDKQYVWPVPSGFGWSEGQKFNVSASLPAVPDSIRAVGSLLSVSYSEPLDESSVPARTAFTVKVDGGAGVRPTEVSVSGHSVTLTLASAVESGQTVTVSYAVPSTNPLRQADGVPAVGLTDQNVSVRAPASTARPGDCGHYYHVCTGVVSERWTESGTRVDGYDEASGRGSIGKPTFSYIDRDTANMDTTVNTVRRLVRKGDHVYLELDKFLPNGSIVYVGDESLPVGRGGQSRVAGTTGTHRWHIVTPAKLTITGTPTMTIVINWPRENRSPILDARMTIGETGVVLGSAGRGVERGGNQVSPRGFRYLLPHERNESTISLPIEYSVAELVANHVGVRLSVGVAHPNLEDLVGDLVLEWAGQTLPLNQGEIQGSATAIRWDQTWLNANAPSLNEFQYKQTLPVGQSVGVCLRAPGQTCPSSTRVASAPQFATDAFREVPVMGSGTETAPRPIGEPLTATDTRAGTLVYSLSGLDGGKFTIDENGQMWTKAGETYEWSLPNAKNNRVTVTVTNSTTGATATGNRVILSITDPLSALPELSVADTQRNESASPMSFTVSLTWTPEWPVTVDWETADGTALAGEDYTAASGTLTFRPGETLSKTVTVALIDDLVPDDGETLSLLLENSRGATIADAEAMGTINNSEGLAALFENVPESHDGSGAFTLRVLFSEELASGGSGRKLGQALELTGATRGEVRRVDGRRDLYEFQVRPSGDGAITVGLSATTGECDASDAICTAGGLKLSGTVSAEIPGPDTGQEEETSEEEETPQEEQTPLTASFGNVPESHDGTDSFTIRVSFSEAVETGFARMRDEAFTVTGGSVTSALRVDGESDLWEITIEPSGTGAVTVTLPETTGECTATGAICTSDGRKLSAAVSAEIAGPPLTPLTASLSGMPAEHDGSSAFTLTLTFSEAPENMSFRTVRDSLFTVSGGRIKGTRRSVPGSDLGFNLTVEPSGNGAVTLSLATPLPACGQTGAVCASGGRSLTGPVTATVQGPPAMSVADAEVNEGPNAVLAFAVSLGRAASGTVTVDYATSDVSATAGNDYTATSGTLTFSAGETSKTVSVPVLDDSHDDDGETLTLTLSNLSGAYISDGTATGTIHNSDPMPQAWLTRFGRAAADQAVQSIGERVREGSRPEQPNQLILGGRRVDNFFSRQSRTPQGGAGQADLLIDPRLLTGEHIPGGSGFVPRSERMKDSGQSTGLLNENPMKDSGVDSGLINESPEKDSTRGDFMTAGGPTMGTGFAFGGGTATGGAGMMGGGSTMGGGLMGAGSMAASPMGVGGMMNSGAMGAGSMGGGSMGMGSMGGSMGMGSMGGSMGGSMQGGSMNGPMGGGQLMGGGQPQPLITRQRGPVALPSGGSAGYGPGAMYDAGDRRLIPTMRDLMRGASFDYSRPVSEDNDANPGWLGDWSTWGRSAETRFSGAEDSLSVNGEVRTGTVGFDSRWNRWTGGLAVSHSEGFGGYTSPKNPGGTITSTLTTLLPYAGYTLSDHTNLWAALGYGAGNLSLTPGSRANTGDTHLTGTAGIGDTHFPGSGVYTGDTHLPGAELAANTRDTHHTGLTTKLAAFGGRGAFDARIAGIQLAWVSDAFLTETESETVQGLMGATGASSRARLMLEGTGTVNLLGGVLSPRVEAGLRYDGGDAETGAGFEVGGGLQYATGRLTVQLNARGLLAHQASAYEEWGYSGSVTFRPGEERRGLSMRLGTDWGAAQSGVQSMWSQAGASRMARGGMSANAAQRFQAELGYGLQRRYSEWFLEPFVTAESSQGNEALRYGLKLTSGERFEAGLEIGRRVMGTAHTEQAAQLSGQFRW